MARERPRRRRGPTDRPGVVALVRGHPLATLAAGGADAVGRDRAGWRLEPLWNGLRVLIARLGDDVRVATAERDWTSTFAGAAAVVRGLPARACVLDAELCALDDRGRPDLDRLRAWIAAPRGTPPVLIARDLLHLDGDDLRGRPLDDRVARLTALAGGALVVSGALDGALDAVLASVTALGLPGVLARRRADPYPAAGARGFLTVTPTGAPPAARSLSPAPAVTNPAKVLYPRDGLTKADVVAYYRAVAPALLPLLRDRPVVGQRWPDGIDDFTWYQHRVPPRAPDYVRPVWIDGIRRIVLDDEDGLTWMVNQASLTFHGFCARAAATDQPDWTCLDLDPGPATAWDDTVAIALAIRALLERLGLTSLVKTSGQTGLHVLIPLAPGHRHDDAIALAQALVAEVVRRDPDRVTLETAKARRGGRLLLDHRQGAGKLLVLPYSLRAVDGARASTPLAWSEVTPALEPRAFTLRTLRARLDAYGDLAAPLLTGTNRVAAALARL